MLDFKRIFFLCFAVILVVATTAPIGPNDISRYDNILSVAKGDGLSIDRELAARDTMDKVRIGGHFYSDKPPLFALTFAPIFSAARSLGVPVESKYLYKFAIVLVMGLTFAWAMTLFYSEYAARFPAYHWLLLALIFATPYYVFNRVLMSHALVGSLLYIAFYLIDKGRRLAPILLAGLLAGLAVTYDHGALFLVFSFLLYLLLVKRWRDLFAFGAALLPPLGANLLVVHRMSGSFLPLNMRPELFEYPGSVFSAGQGTGGLKHTGLFPFLAYFLALLFLFPFGYQSKGLFLSAPILLFAFWQMWREAREKKPEAVTLLTGIVLVFFYYAFTSNNLAGGDYTVRWFIIFIPLCLPYVVRYYDALVRGGGRRGWFNTALVWSLLISLLYSFVSWLGGLTPLF